MPKSPVNVGASPCGTSSAKADTAAWLAAELPAEATAAAAEEAPLGTTRSSRSGQAGVYFNISSRRVPSARIS